MSDDDTRQATRRGVLTATAGAAGVGLAPALGDAGTDRVPPERRFESLPTGSFPAGWTVTAGASRRIAGSSRWVIGSNRRIATDTVSCGGEAR